MDSAYRQVDRVNAGHETFACGCGFTQSFSSSGEARGAGWRPVEGTGRWLCGGCVVLGTGANRRGRRVNAALARAKRLPARSRG